MEESTAALRRAMLITSLPQRRLGHSKRTCVDADVHAEHEAVRKRRVATARQRVKPLLCNSFNLWEGLGMRGATVQGPL